MQRGRDDRIAVVVGLLVLIGLTGLSIVPLYLYGLDVLRLSPQSVPPLVGIGIELTAYAPSLAAILVAGLLPGAGGLRPLLGQLLRWRVHPLWYGLALLGPIAVFLLAEVIHLALGGAAPRHWLALPSGFALAFLVGSLIAGSLGEEIGWRGFAQPRLQGRYGALAASLMIGVVWTLWHHWGLAAPGGIASESLGGFGLSLVRMTALAILYAWMYNCTRASLVIAMVAHAGHNIANNVVGAPADGAEVGFLITVMYGAAALAVAALTQPKTLTK